ncbi:U-box domain-containing protein 34 isoform X2 [Brachypodium distachyon]|uniref:U-box domain-containing protein 34 isoform X2 n=1 Tax=Brachypodium distachyon TaxID=15368 RepID=UPI000D0D5F3A|nr:U-box domain-containing protein 34 isoform X2 [Brachypodium distachyon]|eukprot:XP_024318619.1 U-box domain-containing protein 34 isoform X2 [Brachypodium distachyon]
MASSSSSTGGDPQAKPVAVAVAVRGDGRASRRAARWAAANLALVPGRVVLVHVIPPVSFVPSPSGERVPVERMEPGVVEMYAQDRRERAQEVETVVLEGDSVSEALARYAAESGVRNLVLGSACLSWFRRILRLQNLPTTVLKATPCSCNVFIVSRRQLTVKFANLSQTGKSNTYVRIQSISHRAYALIQRNWLQVKHSLHGLPDDETPKSSGVTSSDLCSQACSSLSTSTNAGRKTPGRAGDKEFDAIGQLKEFPCVSLSSTEGPKPIDDVAKLRKELQNTLMTYGEAHEDVVHAKKKIQVLSNDCSEDLKEVQDALRREELLKQTAAYEKSKHFRAITDTEMVKEAFTCEAYSKHKTESVANMMSTETGKVVDALLCTGKTCRRYLRHEIELATDNFSDAKKIGEGGYGIVYRCTLDHTEVAVKVIQQDSSDKIDEFFKEVEILSQLHHPNLVLLLGFCPEIGCLVYEYMENGSLEDQLINNKGCQPLHWFMRFQIIFEVARGLAFLHGTKPEPIVHRDLKPGNILLDKNYVSKIGDVGFAKLIADLVPDGFTEYRDTVIAGTLYYMDPEYQLTGTVRPKSDLFALGIIVLQLLTGKHPHGLILSAEEAIRKDTFSDILDQSQTDWPIAEAETLAKLGLRCTALKCRDRPNLESEVLPVLEDLLSRVTSSLKSRSPNVVVPSHFVCPILQEVMDDPYVAADGHTYEYRAIKAWLKKHKISPVTKHKLPNSSIIPSHSLHAAIQRWKSQSS